MDMSISVHKTRILVDIVAIVRIRFGGCRVGEGDGKRMLMTYES